jgi:multisubunit Na+/H+ antiporter MnhC subunit
VSNPRRLDLLYGAHLALVLVLGAGRLLRAIEIAGASSPTSFAASASGRAVALSAMVVGVAAIAVVVVGSVRQYRDGRVLLLLVLLGCALASRREPDALDLVYAAAALGLSALWFLRGRRLRSGPERRSGASEGRLDRPNV